MLWSVVVVSVLQCVAALCPWDETGLQAWSDPNTWGGTVPGINSKVLISGKKVLLDVSPLDLATIEISSDAALIWGNVDGIKVSVSYILVKGEFHIGSTDCPFTKDAHIFLTGKSNSPHNVTGFGRKFIGVTEGATLEFHGAEKKAWTKLIQSVPAASLTCGLVYSVEEQRYADSSAFGLHVTVWNIDGSLNDFNVFPLSSSGKTGVETDFKDYVESLDAGLIVAIAVYGDLGVTKVPGRNWEDVYSSIETLGGLTATTSQIRNIDGKEAYAFITMKGNATSTSEQYVDAQFSVNVTRTSIQKFIHQEKALEFRTRSQVKAKSTVPDDENQVDFEVLTIEVSQPIITVRDDVSSWNTGDEIIVTSTDFDWRQVEEFKILDCPDCSNKQIKLDGAFQYPHYGKITHGVDERAEVALLTRNIKIEGELQPKCYDNDDPKAALLCERYNRDTFGAHVKFVRGFKSVHVEGVEFYHMGQQLLTGTYPIHYHMCDAVEGSSLSNNSIHRSNNRCITIHGTDGAELSDNVCYDHLGHGFFLEDSVEQRNILDGNLGVGTKYGTQLLTDMAPEWCPEGLESSCDHPATYWITHPNNIMKNNVAAGAERNGFHILFSKKPLTISAARQAELGLVFEDHARLSKIGLFDRNVAHSNRDRGLMFDRMISNGQVDGITDELVPENGLIANSRYDPRVTPDKNSPRAESIIKRLTAYRNRGENIWSKGGKIVYDHASIADAPIGVAMTRSVLGTAQEIRNSVVIGETENLGMPLRYRKDGRTHNFERSFSRPLPNLPLVGVEFFFGIILVKNTFFDKFNHWTWNSTWETEYGEVATRRAAALGFNTNFPYPSLAQNGVEGAVFGFCDTVDGLKVFAGNSSLPFFDDPKDGDLQASFRDYDGSITGIANVQLVRKTPFFLDYDCYYNKNYQMSVCPREYSKILFKGSDGVFKGAKRTDYPMYMVRDDVTDSPFAIRGDKSIEYLTMQNKGYVAVFNGTNPTDVTVRVNNLANGSYIRLALCFPKGTTDFTITGSNPKIDNNNLPISVDSMSALEADTTGRAYFWDSSRGLFFLRFDGTDERQNSDEECPASKCPSIRIKRNDGGTDPIDCFQDAYVNGPYKVTPQSPDPITPPTTPCVRAEIDGRGAVDPAELLITAPELTQTCHTFDSDKVPQPCGTNNVGYRIGSGGKCYAVINQFDSYIQSKYLCYRMGGILAPIPDLGSEREIRNHIYRFGQPKKNYWVNEVGDSENTFMEMQFNNYYNPTSKTKGNKNGPVCLFDFATTPCRTGWTHIGNSCYLFEDVTVRSYTQAEEFCSGEFMSILSIENAEENEAVRTFVSNYNPQKTGAILLAYKYSSANNQFEWQDGETTTYSPWASGQGVGAVAADGDCARLFVSNGQWKNTPCDKTNGRLVCKTSVNV